MIKFCLQKFFISITACSLVACTTLPGQGPSSMDIALLETKAGQASQDYTLVQLDANVVSKVGAYQPTKFSSDFSRGLHSDAHQALGIGDQLQINIWEAIADGLFSTPENKQTQIKAEVNEQGEIYIPYVGTVVVAGKSIEQVRVLIEEGLHGKAVEPQVQVALVMNVSNNVVMVGDLQKPGQYPISVNGLRLMEAVARAGGSRVAAFESEVTVVRGEQRGSVRLDDVVNYRENNIWLNTRDTVELLHKPLSYSAFGAVSAKNLLPFKTQTLSLAEALAQAGGLNDSLADAGGVFLFRFEAPDRIQSVIHSNAPTLYNGAVATIYRLDFSQPQAFFLASSFNMHDKDIIYVANAPAVEFNKFISMFVTPMLSSSVSVKRVGE